MYVRLFLFTMAHHNFPLSCESSRFLKRFYRLLTLKMGGSFSKVSSLTIIPSSKAETLGPYVVTSVQHAKVEQVFDIAN